MSPKGSSRDGFEIDKKGLDGLADDVHEDAGRVRGYVKTMRGMQCPSQELLGEYGDVAGAYGKFLEAWTSELTVTAGAMDEVEVGFRKSAGTYKAIDTHHADNYDRGMRPR
ncbi:hypothetical protein EV193_11681 [Herbihabitans rhizosphaerae]|uniref:Excreted virulence factor EspC (Type VII ESX diderm) n=1 Tax=Herbihabitans rhizosphaerae TaxID=1872711 RepID=A0A4Q7KET2_9PSEU|nr:hypothetical protein [Herbihabitans rhizosphaerae]RZS30560.1 hypothetical protein EV193_11681 [Herbihabitans rhizosphaerae]